MFHSSALYPINSRITTTGPPSPGGSSVVGLAALAITLLTVSYQAIKAALANPVKSLRRE